MYKIIENLNSYAMTTVFRYICLPVLLFFCFVASTYSNSQLEVGDWDIDDDSRADARMPIYTGAPLPSGAWRAFVQTKTKRKGENEGEN